MSWLIRIKRGQRKTAAREFGIRIRPRRIFVRFMPSHDIYTSRRMATRFKTKRKAVNNADYLFEEVVKA